MWAGQGGRVEDMILAKLFGGGILLRVPRRGCMDWWLESWNLRRAVGAEMGDAIIIDWYYPRIIIRFRLVIIIIVLLLFEVTRVLFPKLTPPLPFSSVTQSCPTLCDPVNCSTPGLPVHHQLPEFTQTHVHQVRDAIQPSHPLSPPSPPAPNPSQHQGIFQWVNFSHEVAKVLEFQLQHQSFQRTPRTDLLEDGLVGSPPSPRDSQESSPTP